MAVVLTERADTARDEQIRPQAKQAFSVAACIGRAGRSVGQIALFTVFGIYGALMSALIVPAYSLLRRDKANRAHHIRRVMYYSMRAYVGSMRVLRLIDLEVSGLDRMPAPGSLLVANHPSLIDALILLGYVKDAVVVAKRSLQVNPFTWGGIRGADYVVNADPQALIDECGARIAAGETLVLFPECTRTADDGVIRLRRGAAHIAVRSGCPGDSGDDRIFGAIVDEEKSLVAGTQGAAESARRCAFRDQFGTVSAKRSQRFACSARID